MKTENMHCNFCADGMYHCPEPEKYRLHPPVHLELYKGMEHKFWTYKCKSCGAEIDRNINPHDENKNNFTLSNGSVVIEN